MKYYNLDECLNCGEKLILTDEDTIKYFKEQDEINKAGEEMTLKCLKCRTGILVKGGEMKMDNTTKESEKWMDIPHSQDIIKTLDNLIETLEPLFEKGKIYKGEDILLMLNKVKSFAREVF